jgi:hypothetical protein
VNRSEEHVDGMRNALEEPPPAGTTTMRGARRGWRNAREAWRTAALKPAGGWPKGGANVPWGGTRDCENADAEKFANENKGDVAREQDMATGWTTLVMVGDTLANWCWEGGWQLEEPAGWGECGKLRFSVKRTPIAPGATKI